MRVVKTVTRGMPIWLCAVLLAPSGASAASRVYWTTWGSGGGDSGAIRVGDPDGIGSPRNLGPNYGNLANPTGVAIDPAAGKIYWGETGSATANPTIRMGNLDGSGSPRTLFTLGGHGFFNQPYGVAIDRAARKIYWADYGEGAIWVANLDGSGSPRNLNGRDVAESGPYGLAIDPAGGKIYWSDYFSGLIRVGSITGSFSPHTLYSGEAGPKGLSIVAGFPPGFNQIYWANSRSGQIRMGHLSGSGSASNLYSRGSEQGVADVAAEPNGSVLYYTAGTGENNWAIGVGDIGGNCCPGALGPNYKSEVEAQFVTAVLEFGSRGQSAKITKAIIRRRHHRAKFTFKATGRANRFQCALIKQPKGKHKKKPKPKYHACKSPKTYRHLKRGRYTFYVRALSGRLPGTPATKNFKIT